MLYKRRASEVGWRLKTAKVDRFCGNAEMVVDERHFESVFEEGNGPVQRWAGRSRGGECYKIVASYGPADIFVRGAQPILVNNIIRDNSTDASGTVNGTGPAISIII